MANRIFCDHCGEECSAPLRQEWYATKVNLPRMVFHGHLCDDCAAECAGFFGATYPRSVTGAQPKTVAERSGS